LKLYNKLKELAASDMYPLHMPGHKRVYGCLPTDLPYNLDITEIDGFDDLREPRGLLKETADLAAKLYGSKKAFLLINGSTAGILSAIGAQSRRGDKILIARNNHWSIDNAVELFGLQPIYIEPNFDDKTGIPLSVSPDSVKSRFEENPDIKLVVITSPSYEGVISNISEIAKISHNHNATLIVDQAHGAHLGFSPKFSGSAINAGADVVVMSLHKTLPALTQCSLLHACSKRANLEELQRLLSIFQTSSPSYVLMASIDCCLRLLETDSNRLFTEYEQNIENFQRQIKLLENFDLLWHSENAIPAGVFAYDLSKIVISTKNTAISGVELMVILRNDFKIELEKSCEHYAIAMTSIYNSSEGFSRLAAALNQIKA
jgi:arginine/lysine/ornithine decarboxylase